MSRKFIAAILAASIAITSFAAAPARAASDEDIAKFLFGAAALAIIGKAINDSNRDQTTRFPDKEIIVTPRPDRRKVLPRRCVTRANTALGNNTRVLRAKCLKRHYQRANRLPNSCRLPIWTQNGRKPAYLARCLRDRGYTIARP